MAEVLITLGIIGVVAAMTLPTLIQKQQEKATVTALKKFYSTISQAYIYAKNDYGTPNLWYDEVMSKADPQAADTLVDVFTKYLKVSKVCHREPGCFPDVIYKKIDGNSTLKNYNVMNITSKIVTADGISVSFYSYGSNPVNNGVGHFEETYGTINVDINGLKKPNKFGEDMFTFIIAKDGIFPYGLQGSTIKETLEDSTVVNTDTFPKGCNRKDCYSYCEACAAWVIYNENMDYLHCDDLSWDGKKKCQ